MRLKLLPREDTFFGMFGDLAGHVETAADLLARLIEAEPAARVGLAARMKDREHAADETTHGICRRVNSTFVTPFDRDDIHALASALDDCLDQMEEAGEMIVLFDVGRLPALVGEQVRLLRRAARLTADAMPRLRTMTDLDGYCIEVNRLENEADKAHRQLLADLFRDPRLQASPAGVVELMRLRSVIDTLEAAADAFENVANVVEAIALKES